METKNLTRKSGQPITQCMPIILHTISSFQPIYKPEDWQSAKYRLLAEVLKRLTLPKTHPLISAMIANRIGLTFNLFSVHTLFQRIHRLEVENDTIPSIDLSVNLIPANPNLQLNSSK